MRTRLPLALVALAVVGCGSTPFSKMVKELFWNGRLAYGPRTPSGQQVGVWKYWYDGAHEHLKARGTFEDDQPTGAWEFWDESGQKRWEVVLDDNRFDGPSTSWHDNGMKQAEGAFDDGTKSGPWTFWHRNGSLQARGSFEADVREGRWTFWDENGDVLAETTFVDGAPSDVASEEPPPTPPAGIRSIPFSITVSGEAASASAEETGGEEIVREPGYFTLDELSLVYGEGKAPIRSGSPSSGYGASDPRNPPNLPKRDEKRSEPLLDQRLDFPPVWLADGSKLDINDFTGKSKVLLIVLRGMQGVRVCEYCASLTRELRRNIEEFRLNGGRVVIVYPGENECLEAFQQQLGDDRPEPDATGDGGAILACDPGMRLVQMLGIRDELAMPTALVIDKDGYVRHSFVGRNKQDRESIPRLVEVMRAVR